MAGEEKTEKATPKRRRDERKKGNVFLSKDAVAVATLFASIAALRIIAGSFVPQVGSFLQYCVELTRAESLATVSSTLISRFFVVLAQIVGPMLGVTVLAAVAATFAQTRFLVSGQLMKPKFSRISPKEGFKRLFSLRSLMEAFKGLLKIIVLLYLIYSCLRDLVVISPKYLYAEIPGSCRHLFDAIFLMLIKVGVAFLVLAALDFLYQWWDYERQLKMSKQEIKEEYKQMEGDPQIKSKIKEVQRRMAQSRMMQQVKDADVIVRNPTHVAVALRYHPGEDEAPIVLAMGLDELALRIISVAESHQITIIENVPLARALYAQAELNRAIPPDLYEAVAEIMIYLYKLGKLQGKAPEVDG